MTGSRSRFAAAALGLALLAGCDKPVAIGGFNNIVIGAADSVFRALDEEITRSLEPRIFTVRDERVFEVSVVDPRGAEWRDLSKIRQILVIGEPADPWIARVLEEAEQRPSPPALVQTSNVWAQNQGVTAIVVPPGSPPEAAAPLLAEAGDSLLAQYERFSRARMFTTGMDEALADSLRRTLGFSLAVPTVYRAMPAGDSALVIRNDNPDPSQLIREMDVAWRPAGTVELTPDAVLQWRRELAARVTDPAQVTDSVAGEPRRLSVGGNPALEIHGTWSNPPGEWPAAGPWIARAVQCPQRTVLLSAWLYAPGAAKYQYMIQLEMLLDGFRCA